MTTNPPDYYPGTDIVRRRAFPRPSFEQTLVRAATRLEQMAKDPMYGRTTEDLIHLIRVVQMQADLSSTPFNQFIDRLEEKLK